MKNYYTHFKKILLSIVFLFIVSISLLAQPGTPAYLNNTGTTANAFPFNTTANIKIQWIYVPGAFTTLGGGAGSAAPGGMAISKIYIKFSATVNATTVYPNFSIALGQNLGTQPNWGTTSITTYPFTTGLTTCFSQASGFQFTGITANAWYGITLQNPFPYDPSLSLIVEAKSTLTTAGGNGVANVTTAGQMQRLYGGNAATTGTSNTGLTPVGFDLIASGPCTNPPTAGNSTATPSTPVCIGTQVALGLIGNTGGSGQTYQWFSDPSFGGSYTTAVSGVLSSAAFNINPSSTLYYRCEEICSGGTPAYSTPVQVAVNPAFPGGTYTINSALATGGTNFQTFAAAVNALSCGIAGPVILNVDPASGPYNEQVEIPQIGGASAVNTITINGNGRTLTQNLTGTPTNYTTLNLNGADNFIFNNLNIEALGATYGFAVHLMNSADNNTFSNCSMAANTTGTGTTAACVSMSGSVSLYSTAGTNGMNNTFTGCTLNGGYFGFVFYGTAPAGNTNNSITNCTVRNYYVYGSYNLQQGSSTYSNNIFERPTRASVSTGYGIMLTTGCTNMLIEKNRVRKMWDAAPTSTGTTYCLYDAATATAGNENKFYNNLVSDINFNGTIYGMYLSGASYVKAYHNTISLDQTTATGTTTTYGIYATGTAGVDVRNNIVSIKRGGSGVKQCIYFSSATGVTSNKNDLYINALGGTNYVGFFSTGFATLTAWQSANGSVWDQQSQSINPGFSNPGTGAYNPTSGIINDIGDNVGITTDILGNARSATPDPGAYEFVPPTLDALISWLAPVPPIAAGPNTVSVNIFNNQVTTITSIDLEYTDGVTPVTESFTGLNITTGSTQQINFTTPYIISGNVSLKAYISAVNGVTDGDQNNDTTLTQNLCLPLAGGTYTINSTLATGGTNFQTFTAAVSKMVSCGINGPIIFDVVSGSGPYIEQIDIPQISGSSAINTVTFNGNNCVLTQTLTGTPANYATLSLSGADYFTFNNLNIEALGATYGFGIHLMNSSNNNTFNNCNISANTTGTGTTTACVSMSGSLASYSASGNNGINNLFSGCNTTGGYFGFAFYGNGTSYLGNTNNSILNCTIQDYYVYGCYNYYQGNSTISGNTVQRPTRTSVSTGYGIILTTGCVNVLVEKNRVRNLFGGSPTSTSTAYCLYDAVSASAGLENRFINNVVSNMNFEGILYMMYLSGASFVKVYHNTLDVDHPTSTTTSSTYGIYASGASSVDIRNNIVFIRRGGTGIKTVLYYPTIPTFSNNNGLYLDYSAGTNYIGYNGASYSPLTAWQSGSGFDLQSKELDPLFLNPGAGDFTPTATALNAFGANVGVSTDILGNSRVVAFPDPGAFEFNVPGLDGAITWVSPVNPVSTGPLTVILSVGNLRTTTITSLDLTYTDGVTPVTQSFTGLSLFPGTSQQFTFTTPYNMGSSASLTGYISAVNTIADDDQLNDTTLVQNLCVSLSGTYTIDAGAPASATNFQSFSAAANALSCGISSPVIFNVASGSGPYNEQINIPVIAGTSAVNTITFNCSNQLLTYDATASSYYATLNLSGADYITFNDLNVAATGAANAWGIHFINGSDNNTFNNCTSTVSITSTTTTTQAIVMNASNITYSTGGSGGNNNAFNNCIFTGGYYGVVLYGASGAGNSGNVFIGCSFKEAYAYSTYNLYTTNGIIRNCIMERPTRTSTSTATGGYFSTGCSNMLVEKNRVRNMFGGTGTTTGTFYGFACPIAATAGNENKFYNNLISDINFNGTIYGLYLSGASYVKAYHNTLSLDHTASTATATTYGFYSTGTAGLDFRNNIITITRGGTGTKYGLYYTGTVTTSNNNDVVVIPGATNYFGYNGTAYATLVAWQGATTYDALSKSIDPVYADPVSGDFTFTAYSLNNTGANVGVTTDILGSPRNAITPDPGAFETDFPPIDLGAVLVVSPGTGGCYSTTESVVVRIKNYGTDTLNFSSNPATVTCNVSGTSTAILTGNPSGILNPGATMDVTLTSGTIDMSALGSYTFNAYTTIASDGKAANDNMPVTTRTKVAIIPGTVTSSTYDICLSGFPTLTLANSSGGNIQWQKSIGSATGPFSNVGTGATNYTPLNPDTMTTYYRALLSCYAAADSSASVTVLVEKPAIISTTPATRCGPGSVTLQAAGTGAGTLNWYHAPTGGSALLLGSNTFTTNVNATDTFYVEEKLGTSGGTPLLISEIDIGANDQLEIMNVSQNVLNLAGYKVAISDDYTNINAVNANVQILSGTLNPGAVLTWTDLSTATNYWGSNMLWNPGAYPTYTGWAAILDVNNNLVDFVPLNWPAASIQSASVTIGVQTITVGSQWSGNGIDITNVTATQSVSRQGNTDNNNLSDFAIINLSIGSLNPGMTIPFTGFGCSSIRAAVPATVTAPPPLSISGTSTLCLGTSTTLSVNAGISDYSNFDWSPSTGLSATTGTTVTATPSLTTKYFLNASGNINNCQAVDSITVTVNDVPLQMLVDNPLICATGTAQLNASVGAGSFSYQWSPSTGLSATNIANPTAQLSSPSQVYSVLVTDLNTACTKAGNITLYGSNPQLLSSQGATRCGAGPVTLTASGTAGLVNWYNQASGGILLNTGSPYTPTVSSTTTFYPAIKEVIPQTPVTTTFTGATTATDPNAAGNMFNITALHDITVSGFDIHLNNNNTLAPSDISVYYKAGTYIGFTTTAGAWTLAGSVSGITSAGAGVPTALPLNLSINIPAGQTYGFYIVVTNLGVSNSLRYKNAANSPAEGAVAASDYNMQVSSGTVVFGPFTGLPAAPINRLWNGNVKYYIGCESPRGLVTAIVNPAPLLTVSLSDTICNQEVAILNVTSALSNFDSYVWLPVTNLFQDLGCTMPYTGQNLSTVYIKSNVPVPSTAYTCFGHNTATLCDNTATTNITVIGLTNVVATADQSTICLGVSDSLKVTFTGSSGLATNVGLTAVVTSSGGGATASGYGPELLNNDLIPACDIGSVTFNWGWVTTGGWYLYTWPSPQQITKVVFFKSNRPFSTLNIETSNDGINFTPLVTGFTGTATCSAGVVYSSVDSIILSSTITTRYLRFNNIAGTNPNFREIKVYGPPGNSHISYVWNPGGLIGPKVNVTPSVSGINNYNVSIFDSITGCTTVASVAINVNANPHVFVYPNDTTLCTGNIINIVARDSGTYSNGWPAGTMFDFGLGPQTDSAFAVNGPGLYQVIVTLPFNLGGCQGTSQYASINYRDAPVLFTNVHNSNINCSGLNTGYVSAQVFLGAPPYRFVYYNQSGNIVRNFVTSLTEDTLKNLGPGQYCVVVTDTITSSYPPPSCKSDSVCAIVLEQPCITVTAVNTPCTYLVSNISSTVTGGTPPYQYLWSNGKTTFFNYNVTVGTYTVTVTDANDFTSTASIAVAPPGPITITGTSTNLLCRGVANGTINISVAGGVPAYAYLWNGGTTTQNRSALAAGTYTITVTDVNGCTKKTSFTITQPATNLQINTSKTNVRCFGLSSGSITIAPSGGSTPYSYAWNTFPVQTTATISGLAAATYTCTITDAIGCIKSAVVNITEPADIVVFQTQTNVTFPGGNNGSATVSATGGTPGYTYSWNTVPVKTTATVSGLTAGTYKCTVLDSKSCVKKVTFIITEPIVRLVDPTDTRKDWNMYEYPNPTSGLVVLSFVNDVKEMFLVTFTDYTGRLLYRKESESQIGPNTFMYDFTAYAKGIYFIKIESANKSKIIKIVIQ